MSLKQSLKALKQKIKRYHNSTATRHECYICHRKFRYFLPFRGGSKIRSPFIQQLDMVGSNFDHFKCMYCDAIDRERHFIMYLDVLDVWSRFTHARVLHFAPEKHIADKIRSLNPAEYIQADLFPQNEGVQKIDATDIPFSDNYFDILIANHILEHIPNYMQALKEFYRVLRPGGSAFLQTPYSRLLTRNFEDEGIQSEAQRFFFYGQENHVRVFGEKQFFESLSETGFHLQIQRHQDVLQRFDPIYYGVPQKEDLIWVIK